MKRNQSALTMKQESMENYFKSNSDNIDLKDRKALLVSYLKEQNFKGDFSSYLRYLKENPINMKGIYHLMIPAEAIFAKTFYFRHSAMNEKANQLANQLQLPERDTQGKILQDVVEDYMIAGELVIPRGSYFGFSEFQMPKEESERILTQYEPIYGKDMVAKVKQYVKSKI